MKTYEILHEVGIAAKPDAIYQALTEVKKLAGWWTSDTRGDSKLGGTLEFWFGEHCQKFEVTALNKNELVRWKGVGDEDNEWTGTEITFTLKPEEEQCMVAFSHAGWKSDKEALPHCSTKWAVFMLSLKDLLEKGKGAAFPNDMSINHW